MLQPKRGFLSAATTLFFSFVFVKFGQPIFNFEVERVWDKTVVPFLTQNAPSWVATVADYLGSFWGGAFTILAIWGCFEANYTWRRHKSAFPKINPSKVRDVARQCIELSRAILKDHAHWEQVAPAPDLLVNQDAGGQYMIEDWHRRRKQTIALSAAYATPTITLLYALQDFNIVLPDFDPSIQATARRPVEFELEWQLPFIARYIGVIGEALERTGLEGGRSASLRWGQVFREARGTSPTEALALQSPPSPAIGTRP